MFRLALFPYINKLRQKRMINIEFMLIIFFNKTNNKECKTKITENTVSFALPRKKIGILFFTKKAAFEKGLLSLR